MKILVTPTSFQKNKSGKALQMLKDFLEPWKGEMVFNPSGKPLKADEILSMLPGVDGYIAGLDEITREVIQKAPTSLRVISRYGAGCDNVDVQAAAGKGIVVTNTPGVNSQAVADLTFGLILSVARKISSLNEKVKKGEWPRSTGIELYGKTIGILGLGAIGKAVAERAKGFSMTVLAYDPFVDRSFADQHGICVCTFDEVIQSSDFLSLHLPLNEDSKNLINTETIKRMKLGAIIINTSRGGLIDEAAVYEALKSGRIGGLGLDAFQQEPPSESPLFELEQVVMTPHTGAHTEEAIEKMGILSVQNLINVLSGKPCSYIVNRT